MAAQDFLVELGTEELPPKALATLAAAFQAGIETRLKDAKLDYGTARSFASPRRLAVLVSTLAPRQPDAEVELFGPPVAAAFDNEGQPTKAALGFAAKCGVNFEQLQQLDTDKGKKLAYRSLNRGAPTLELLPALVTAALESLPVEKRMRWGASRVEFVRPVHWLLMLYGTEVVPAEILGQRAGRISYGHRFHYPEAIEIGAPAEYEAKLASPGYVIASQEQRRETIRKQVLAAAQQVKGEAVIDDNLLLEVSALVEWPVALVGAFDADFLRVPQEALISSMKNHQKYFHLVDTQGRLLPHFIAIANIDSTNQAQVVAGNERVIRPRLADAAFFYDADLAVPLDQRLAQLKQVVFQSRLGTLHDKSERIAKLAGALAPLLNANAQLAQRAGLLSKTDLVSAMVKEFPELQGIMGRYYASRQGEPEAVALAQEEQYLPRFAGDRLPSSVIGSLVSVADKLDTICGLFLIGQPPSGVKDPFGIRRASLGVLRILIENQLDLDLLAAIKLAVANYPDLPADENLVGDIFAFMLERFRNWFQEEGIATEVFLAVHARKPPRPLDFQRRIYAVHHFSQLPEATALAAANKRVSNILAKTEMAQAQLKPELLKEAAEQELARILEHKLAELKPLLAAADYTQALEALAQLRAPVDQFFDTVMVMCEDLELRNNRLALLAQLRNLFLGIADISLL